MYNNLKMNGEVIINIPRQFVYDSGSIPYVGANIMPLGVIGNTSDFGSEIGESYSPEATKGNIQQIIIVYYKTDYFG